MRPRSRSKAAEAGDGAPSHCRDGKISAKLNQDLVARSLMMVSEAPTESKLEMQMRYLDRLWHSILTRPCGLNWCEEVLACFNRNQWWAECWKVDPRNPRFSPPLQVTRSAVLCEQMAFAWTSSQHWHFLCLAMACMYQPPITLPCAATCGPVNEACTSLSVKYGLDFEHRSSFVKRMYLLTVTDSSKPLLWMRSKSKKENNVRLVV